MEVMKTPRSVDVAITTRCNLRCTYCSHFTSAGDVSEDLAKEEWLRFFEELGRCAVLDVTLQGAEPFCREDLSELIDGIVRNKMRFSILSNGTLITDETAAFLAATGRCDRVQVSIDGSAPETNDAFRGNGTFLKAIKAIEHLQKHNVPVTVRVTVQRRNVRDLEQVARLLLEDIGLPSFSTNAASYLGLCRTSAEQVQLTAEDRSLAMETLLKLAKKYKGRVSAQAGPLANAWSWLEMERARRGGKAGIPGGGFLTGCSGMLRKIGVRADGVIVPCILLGHIELGRVNIDDFRAIWQDHPELKRLRERPSIPLNQFEYCRGCDYLNYCSGNCPGLSYTILDDAYHPSPDACLRRFLEQGGRLPDDNL